MHVLQFTIPDFEESTQLYDLDDDVDEHFGPVGVRAADVVPVEAVEEVAPVLEADCQWVRVEPVVDPLGIEAC